MVGGANRTVHDNILEVTVEEWEEGGTIFFYINKVDGNCMSLTIKAAIHPVVCVKDKLAGRRSTGNVVHHLHVQFEAVLKTVPAFCQIEIFCTAEKNRLGGGVESGGVIEIETVPVELTTSGADTILVIGMLGNNSVAGSIAEGDFSVGLTLAVGSSRSINLTFILAEYSRYWIWVANVLNPANVALVAVQLIANLTTCHLLRSDNGCSKAENAPVVGNIVVCISAFRTVLVAVCIVCSQINGFPKTVAITYQTGTLAVYPVEVAVFVIDNQTVNNVYALIVNPCSKTTALVSC